MRSTLDPITGRIPEPRSLGAARARHEQISREVARIERTLEDTITRTKYPTESAYDTWRMSAGRAHQYLAEEARQLARWIDAHPEANLLREARDLIARLRSGGVELDAAGLAVAARLEAACEGV